MAGFSALIGCGQDRQAQFERDIKHVQDQVEELKRSRAEHRTRLDELNGRMRILQDRQETSEFTGRRLGRAPEELPVVRLGPTEESEGTYSIVGDGAAETSRPQPAGRPATAPRPAGGAAPARRPFSVETADHAGIDPGERLPITPLPPPPSAVAAGPAAATPSTPSPAAPAVEADPALTPTLTSTLPATSRTPEPRPAAADPGDELQTARATRPTSPAAIPDDGPAPRPSGVAETEYKTAFRLFQGGQYGQSRQVFERFVKTYPKHELTDNSIYWLGEISYKLARYDEALQLFGQVIEKYPTGNKVPDAFLKVGLCYLYLGKDDAARKILQQVRTIFPETQAAEIASSHLKLL